MINSWMKKYKDSIKDISEPVSITNMDCTCDIPGIFAYAKMKGVSVTELTDAEKRQFLKPRRL